MKLVSNPRRRAARGQGWGAGNLNLETASQQENDSVFSAALFYSILRAEGGNPVVRKGALCITFRRTAATIRAGKWAAAHDPDGFVRMEYAKSIWTARDPQSDVVELG